MKGRKSLKKYIELYKTVGTRNADYLFRWLYDVYRHAFFPTVSEKYKQILALDKTKLTILDVLIDDLADNYKLRKKRILNKAAKIPLNEYRAKIYDGKYLKVIQKIWDGIYDSVKKYPGYSELKDVFFFDMSQVMNSMKYNYLVNSGIMGNDLEDSLYTPHGVMVILHADMDFMCSPRIDMEKIKQIRPAIYFAQDIAHIGNLLNTYPREIEEKDFSSPIISLGIRRGIITKDDILHPDSNDIKAKLRRLEDHFKQRVENDFKKMENIARETGTEKELEEYTKRLRKVYEGFLKREKYWEK